jgi:hypothetical protein
VVGVVRAAAREADVFHFWPHDLALGDLKLSGVVVRANRRAPIDARLEGEALSGTLSIRAQAQPGGPAASGEIRAAGLVSPLPSVPGKIDSLKLGFDVAGRSL